jgi:hypothetical protein
MDNFRLSCGREPLFHRSRNDGVYAIAKRAEIFLAQVFCFDGIV